MPKELRVIEVDDVEFRSEGEGDEKASFVEGRGVVYNREVEIWPGFMEKIRSGAFSKTIDSRDEVKSFFNHNPSFVLSTTRSKPPLHIEDGKDALRFKSEIPPTTYGNDLAINLERKNVRGASFSFEVHPEGDTVTRDTKGVMHREIVKATLFEVGPVTNPAYRQTSANLRSVEEVYNEHNEKYERENKAENEIAENELSLKLKTIDLL